MLIWWWYDGEWTNWQNFKNQQDATLTIVLSRYTFRQVEHNFPSRVGYDMIFLLVADVKILYWKFSKSHPLATIRITIFENYTKKKC